MTLTVPIRLFIYGTLLEASQHPMGQLLRDNGSFIARGSIRARLYIIRRSG
jgi:hypothetical protein